MRYRRLYPVTAVRDFTQFCKKHDAWVITPPGEGRARVQIAEGSALLEKIAALKRYPVVKLPGMSQRRRIRKAGFETQKFSSSNVDCHRAPGWVHNPYDNKNDGASVSWALCRTSHERSEKRNLSLISCAPEQTTGTNKRD